MPFFSLRSSFLSKKLTFAVALVATAALGFTGCAGYVCGPSGLYSPSIKKIHVPMADADVYRAAFGERLTEAVCKKITEQ
ncbi:MAG: hypothetical protein HUK22_01915, partial [Thermoguttaceae bacterium]|nr:hypothetical protein [Thermoguttaceae bacterium]